MRRIIRRERDDEYMEESQMVKMKRIDAANDTMKEEEKKMNEKMDG